MSQLINTDGTTCALFGNIQTQTAVPPAHCCFMFDFLKMTNCTIPWYVFEFLTLLPHALMALMVLAGCSRCSSNK